MGDWYRDRIKADEEHKNLRKESDRNARDTTRMRTQLLETGSQLQKLKSQSSMYRQIRLTLVKTMVSRWMMLS